jgi:hypothetical protein
VLANLSSAQLRHHLEARVGGGEPFSMSEVAGRYLQEALFGPGARNRWEDAVLEATGERLNGHEQKCREQGYGALRGVGCVVLRNKKDTLRR